jgi:predicted GNAT superfamily acetyltransferase
MAPPTRRRSLDTGAQPTPEPLEALAGTGAPPKASRGSARAALAVAESAARDAGVAVRSLTDPADTHEADRLLGTIWATAGPGSPVSAHLMRALAHSGNYVSGAWVDRELVGASVAFVALQGGSISLHSHVTGVTRRLQGSGVGLALKLHQRAWALERGMEEIGWSFDPLIRRNAWFNLRKLRAVIVGYEQDFYGPMADRINAGDASDRCLVRWKLTALDLDARYDGQAACAEDPDPSGRLLLDQDINGFPVASDRFSFPDEPVWLCRVPADIEAWRPEQPDRARAWRVALRTTLRPALCAGFVVKTMTRDGCYVLARGPEIAGRTTGGSGG